jgi:glycosyltransferase involved in cell wall biosynthesis
MRRFADVIVEPSGYLVVVFRKHQLHARSIFNFVDLERLPHRERDVLHPVFLSNRNFEPLYNVRCTLDAFALVQREVPEARLILVGDGSQRGALEAQATTLGLRNVTFVGRVPPDRMGQLYDEADIYLNSPDIDNMPGSIIEAYAAGLPIVTTDAGGIPYIVRHEETGLMVPRNDAPAMAAASLRLLREPGLARRLSASARAECLRKYVWPAVEAEWKALYSDLVRTSAPTAA